MTSFDFKIGSRLTLRVDRLSLGGDAVGRAGNLVVFVPYGAPGDTLDVELTETRRNFARARLIRVIESSPVRETPPCPYHFQPSAISAQPKAQAESWKLKTESLFCGGCSWQHMTYPFQVDAKRQLVQETLERVGGLRDVTVRETKGMREPWRYRNKVQQPVGWDGRRMITGFYAPASHTIIPIEDCLVQPELSVAVLNRTRSLLEQFGLHAYDEERHTGWIRHLLIRTAQDKALLVLVTRSDDFPHASRFIESLTRECPRLAGLYQNVNPGKSNVILGRHWIKHWGADSLEERLGALRFRLSPGSFFQVNTLQTEVLYDVIKDFANPSPPPPSAKATGGLPSEAAGEGGRGSKGEGRTLIDLYCGVGGIAIWLAGQFKQVLGVDEVRSAVSDAEGNARLNGISNARFMVGRAETFLIKQPPAHPSQGGLTVVLDPPRAGCDPRVLKALTRLSPDVVIYVSCDPGTLARDLAILEKGGFGTREVQPVDLFPHTPHIETVVRLTRRIRR